MSESAHDTSLERYQEKNALEEDFRPKQVMKNPRKCEK
jgi:hypothetical protein